MPKMTILKGPGVVDDFIDFQLLYFLSRIIPELLRK